MTFVPDEATVAVLVNEFSKFVDTADIPIRWTAPLLNFSMDEEKFDLSDGIRIRRMTDDELSDTYGGTLYEIQSKPRQLLGFDEYVLEIETTEPKAFGGYGNPDPHPQTVIQETVDRVILAMRTFKSGPIGYASLQPNFDGFSPLRGVPRFGFYGLFVPVGSYCFAPTGR